MCYLHRHQSFFQTTNPNYIYTIRPLCEDIVIFKMVYDTSHYENAIIHIKPYLNGKPKAFYFRENPMMFDSNIAFSQNKTVYSDKDAQLLNQITRLFDVSSVHYDKAIRQLKGIHVKQSDNENIIKNEQFAQLLNNL